MSPGKLVKILLQLFWGSCSSHCQEHITLWIQGSSDVLHPLWVLLLLYMLAVFMCFHGRQIFPNSQIQCFYNTLFSVYTIGKRIWGRGGGGGENACTWVHDQCWSVCGLIHINCHYYPSLKGAICVPLVTSYWQFNLPQPALPCEFSHVFWPLDPYSLIATQPALPYKVLSCLNNTSMTCPIVNGEKFLFIRVTGLCSLNTPPYIHVGWVHWMRISCQMNQWY